MGWAGTITNINKPNDSKQQTLATWTIEGVVGWDGLGQSTMGGVVGWDGLGQ